MAPGAYFREETQGLKSRSSSTLISPISQHIGSIVIAESTNHYPRLERCYGILYGLSKSTYVPMETLA